MLDVQTRDISGLASDSSCSAASWASDSPASFRKIRALAVPEAEEADVRGEMALQKALMQADRGDLPGAEATLRGLLATQTSELTRVRALVVLGDLLSGRDEVASRQTLTEAVSLAQQIEDADDVLGFELERARVLLSS